jgi:hypothetical protein
VKNRNSAESSSRCDVKMDPNLIKPTFLLIVLCAVVVLSAVPHECFGATGRNDPMGYELYSWQTRDGGWRFRCLPSPSGVNVTAEQAFNKKFVLNGVGQLKRKISSLPSGATICWPAELSSTIQHANEHPKLSYPPSTMVQEIRAFAGARNIKVEMLSGH